MSGGSYDYIHFKIEEFANQLDKRPENSPQRKAFAKLMHEIADASRHIEWVDSGDSVEMDATQAIERVFSFLTLDKDSLLKARNYDTLKADMLRIFGDLR